MFYSKLTSGFYSTNIHGDNIPSDAVEITDEEHAALLAGQSRGKIISADTDGRPCLINPPPPTSEQLANAARTQRDALLAACDWTQARDIPDAVAIAWQPYRQSLRDLSQQPGFPTAITWPVAP